MIDLHIHTTLSDGTLLPSELIRRVQSMGHQAVAITDHVDASNLEFVISSTIRVCQDAEDEYNIIVIPGVEITYVTPKAIPELVDRARELGAKLILVHGETIVEPVYPGTNRVALESDIDILAHPGLITDEEVELARERGIYLEITTRRGHCYANGHVARLAREHGVGLVLNTDAHTPGDLVTWEMARRVALGAGLTEEEIEVMFRNSWEIVCRVTGGSQT